MGAFLTMEAILAAELEGGFDKPGRVTNIILASPDIDIDLFRAQLAKIENVDKQVFVFTSKDDAALSFSQKISGGIERVGSADAEELEGLGVTVVDLSEIDSTTSGSHSKFAGSPEVVQLIGLGLKDDIDLDAGSQDKLEDFITGVPILFVRN
jgi:esterase/lipase superfamily enzyme